MMFAIFALLISPALAGCVRMADGRDALTRLTGWTFLAMLHAPFLASSIADLPKAFLWAFGVVAIMLYKGWLLAPVMDGVGPKPIGEKNRLDGAKEMAERWTSYSFPVFLLYAGHFNDYTILALWPCMLLIGGFYWIAGHFQENVYFRRTAPAEFASMFLVHLLVGIVAVTHQF